MERDIEIEDNTHFYNIDQNGEISNNCNQEEMFEDATE